MEAILLEEGLFIENYVQQFHTVFNDISLANSLSTITKRIHTTVNDEIIDDIIREIQDLEGLQVGSSDSDSDENVSDISENTDLSDDD